MTIIDLAEDAAAKAARAAYVAADFETQQRARRAYEYMRDRMLPSLAPYARARTRNDALKVELTAGTPRTDGKTIWLRPDIRLGDRLDHKKSICGERDEFDMQLCEACRVTEGVYATMTHEISHMVEGSFEKIDYSNDARIRELMLRVEQECATEARKIAVRTRWEKKPPTNYAEAANMISPWLLLLVNGLEDARVNTSAYKARPGLYKIFRADLNAVLRDGIHDTDGSVILWKDQPIEAQICVALYVKLSQMADYKVFFDPKVIELIDDDKVIKRILRDFPFAKSIDAIFEIGVKLLERLRELGYLRRSEEDEEEKAITIAILTDDEAGDDDDSATAGGTEKPDIVIDMRTKPSKPSASKDDDDADDKDDDATTDDDSPSTGGSPMSGGNSSEDAASDPTPSGGDSSDDADGDAEDDDDDVDDMSGASAGEDADDDEDSDDDDLWSSDDDDDEDDDEDEDFDDDEADDEADVELRFVDDDDDDDDDEGDDEATEFGAVDPYGKVAPKEIDIDLVKRLMEKVGRHEAAKLDQDIETEISRAVSQGDWIDDPQSAIFGVEFLEPVDNGYGEYYGKVEPDSEAIAAASFRCRTIFSENRKASMERNLRTGKINTRVLGLRLPTGDDRLFQKRRVPSEKSYFVLIGLDMSGSTAGENLSIMIRTAARNQAELLTSAGIKFAMYGHTGTGERDWNSSRMTYDIQIFTVKEPNGRWDAAARDRLDNLTPQSCNLDGHTMEIYRKIIERQKADKKLIMYYTDGAMPAENKNEELIVLKREIEYCRRHKIEIVGVGIRTNSPSAHGLETVRIDRTDQISLVLDELERKITR